ncbi:helitron_like_N domain-containing protein [Trichonephila clavata]|uniref:Helitron_like_N domain-containing protein n=1 Tax=Trichonephila clavata TaxID=2740835 RepID=A0A8X6GGY1_TRICU|nr:helitron_like_N domain-containing protein [Trichonephila clavata]
MTAQIYGKENWFDKYEKRSKDLQDISLAQFVSKYYKNNKGEYVKRDEPRVIRYRNYDMATDFNEYKREMVTLNFRHEEKLHKMRADDTCGLPSELILVLNRPYMITNNKDVADGLSNGIVGKLCYVERDEKS